MTMFKNLNARGASKEAYAGSDPNVHPVNCCGFDIYLVTGNR